MALDQIIGNADRVGIVQSNIMMRPPGVEDYYLRVQTGADDFMDPAMHLDVSIQWSSDDHIPPAEESFQDLLPGSWDGGPVDTKSGHRELSTPLPTNLRAIRIYASVVGQSIKFGIRGEWRA